MRPGRSLPNQISSFAVASASGRARWFCAELDAEELGQVAQLGGSRRPDSPRGRSSACRGSGRARCCVPSPRPPRGSRCRSRRCGRRGARRPPSRAPCGRPRWALGLPLTSLSVMPCSWLPTIGRPGLTRVDQRSVTLPPLTLTAPISTSRPSLASRLVVSTSKIDELAACACLRRRTSGRCRCRARCTAGAWACRPPRGAAPAGR